jgi:hypothetical protein
VYFKEGWDRNLISVIVFSISALASVLFGVIWAVYKVDIQGAFGSLHTATTHWDNAN